MRITFIKYLKRIYLLFITFSFIVSFFQCPSLLIPNHFRLILLTMLKQHIEYFHFFGYFAMHYCHLSYYYLKPHYHFVVLITIQLSSTGFAIVNFQLLPSHCLPLGFCLCSIGQSQVSPKEILNSIVIVGFIESGISNNIHFHFDFNQGSSL